jgi:hypothetical protein
MARGVLAGVVVAAALGAVGPAAGGRLPIVRSATVVDRHVVLGLSAGHLRPVELSVAKRRAVGASGALLRKNVRRRETIQLPASAGSIRPLAEPEGTPRGRLVRPGDGGRDGRRDGLSTVLSRNCLDHWSNVRSVVVRAS